MLKYALGEYAYAYSNSLSTTSSEAYRIILEDPGFESVIDVLDEDAFCEWLQLCQNPLDLDICLRIIPFETFSSDSIATRFTITMQMGVTSTTSEFLRCLGTQASDPRLAWLRTKHCGRSVLHYIASRLWKLAYNRFTEPAVSEWRNFGATVLSNGADPFLVARRMMDHAFVGPKYLRSQCYSTPLLESVDFVNWEIPRGSVWWLRQILRVIKLWAGIPYGAASRNRSLQLWRHRKQYLEVSSNSN